MIRILLVDDSEVIRFLLTKSLERDPELRVVATAANGLQAIEMAKQHKPDAILLDIEMPQMDGMTALPKILEASPNSQIIVITGGTRDSALTAIEALEKGAREFVLKPGADGAAKAQEFNEDVRLKIKAIMATPPAVAGKRTQVSAIPLAQPTQAPSTSATPPSTSAVATRAKRGAPIKALVIASSTGGPEALLHIFKGLHGQAKHIPIFITQHMPPTFTAVLAEHISRHGNRPCMEAVDGGIPIAGEVYVAPGGYHLVLQKDGPRVVMRLTQDPPVNSCRPSADPMFSSASNIYRDALLAVVLTGIGQDGLNGARNIVDNGGFLIAQDKDTSVVYGMPRAVAEAGICNTIAPISAIANEIIQHCRT
jgi:two-component system chemotaxis response regulator CheB